MTDGNGRCWTARNARHRVITCPTLSALHEPRLKPWPRVVMPATSPKRSAHSRSSIRGTAPSPTSCSRSSVSASAAVFDSFNLGSQCPQPLVDALVAALDLADVVDRGLPLGGERRQQHRHAGADVGTFDHTTAQRRRPGDDGAVRIAQHDAGAHADELVHEEQPRLEQLLENQQQPCTVSALEPMPSITAPQATRKRARSWTCGSEAALRSTVVPRARTAAISAFSVPVTLGSSRKMSAPVSALASRR